MDYDELIQQGKIKRIFRAKRKLTVPDVVSHTRLPKLLRIELDTNEFINDSRGFY